MFLLAASFNAVAQEVPSPKSHFGFSIGENYQLANYTQTEAYFIKLANTYIWLKLFDFVKTVEGRSQYMMIVTSP